MGSNSKTPATQGELTVWGWNSPEDPIVEAFRAAHPDVHLNYVRMDAQSINQKLLVALVAGSGAPDVAAIEMGYLAEFMDKAADGGIVDLTKRVEPYKDDIFPYAYVLGQDDSGRVLGVPVGTAAAVMFYRVDIFERYGVRPEEIRTWEDYLEAGKLIHEASGGQVKMLSNAESLFFFNAVLNDGRAGFISPDGHSRLLDPQVVQALHLAKQASDLDIDAKVSEWSPEWFAALKNGSVATLLSGHWMSYFLRTQIAPETAGKWRVMPLPQPQQAYSGGTWLVIPKHSQNREAAWEFVRWMAFSHEAAGALWHQANIIPAYKPLLSDPMFHEDDEFFGGQNVGEIFIDATENIPPVSASVNDLQVLSVLASELGSVFKQGKDPEAALQAADAKAKAKGLAK